MKIAVFCSANEAIDAVYFDAAAELGRWIGANGHTLVYGGQNRGLMRCVGEAVHESGGQLIGVIPQILVKRGQRPDCLDVEIPCDNLADRKELMLAQADVCVALPGGIGTLDEVFTMAASHNIGYHSKMVILYDIAGFWDKTIGLLDDLQRRGFIRGRWTDNIQVAGSFEELKKML
ncbi:cytokinin riboside 5'-monophosphate phosphoribohydrolase [Hallella multisaccharivorax DSM 17128]|uniref:Cytokinin riboside 5'-monophosphate phosphoribohydrolase n=1 Tax=Hallella multisaccharivorax DSM 17128 TaxID=688246 RepID=F8NCA6_9BACT|nr:TIGR00730 family Rossman fold protein [Hallella multisaccharivorax]EGN55996.1 hypothetical protein CHP00730 [Hallella multisaccharivorax DSM 17128]GJG29490.1 cytokinin riboside 5'-monophosphate phosphoribohydrolase [Hallella multisaccharivorax DSM 17128]